MITEHNEATGETTIRLPGGNDLLMSGRPKKLISNIFEELRKALDYMVTELSNFEHDSVEEHVPEFIICKTRAEFRRREYKLRYLSDSQKHDFVEKLQPYHGNYLLYALKKYTAISKHRRGLLAIDTSNLKITKANPDQKDEIFHHREIPLSDSSTILIEVKSCEFLLEHELNLWVLLRDLVEHVSRIVKMSHCYFEGEEFRGSIEYPPPHELASIRKILDF